MRQTIPALVWLWKAAWWIFRLLLWPYFAFKKMREEGSDLFEYWICCPVSIGCLAIVIFPFAVAIWNTAVFGAPFSLWDFWWIITFFGLFVYFTLGIAIYFLFRSEKNTAKWENRGW